MDHILPYGAINEAAAALPKMPDFLQKAGAKPDHVQYGGPRLGNQPPNVWKLEVETPYSTDGTWDLVFWPDGNFETRISPANTKGPFITGGAWKTEATSKFQIGKVILNGVDIRLTSLMRPTTYM